MPKCHLCLITGNTVCRQAYPGGVDLHRVRDEEPRYRRGMPLIQISQTPGLNDAQKADVIAAVTKAYAQASGKSESAVWVTLTDVPRESWGIGGVPLSQR